MKVKLLVDDNGTKKRTENEVDIKLIAVTGDEFQVIISEAGLIQVFKHWKLHSQLWIEREDA